VRFSELTISSGGSRTLREIDTTVQKQFGQFQRKDFQTLETNCEKVSCSQEQGCSSTACHTRDGACSETASENSLSSEQTTSGKVGSLKRNAADHQPSEQKKAKLG